MPPASLGYQQEAEKILSEAGLTYKLHLIENTYDRSILNKYMSDLLFIIKDRSDIREYLSFYTPQKYAELTKEWCYVIEA